ncbi:hypothetical protein FGIG_09314 [Fasciola gigantica]|uniref:BSD domain-containing protein n=1 Tax=Fasciola gigantica TaxID=46835 RepID=A0A504YF08_FASGI|nr:hypothetical protein FGIG_09314 [Fasciola gigantica]
MHLNSRAFYLFLAPEDKVAAPPALSELPLLSSLRLDVSDLLSGFMTSLFGSNDLQQPAVIRGRREARLQIIRADPATYECEPSPPPPHLSVHSYADWRSAYFDEVTCQPRPGIPLCETRDPKNEHQSPNSLLEPPHPSPEELLDQYPFMRTYLTQLVQVEGQPGGKGLTDADFWSRYYYRVWLLDVTERRRQKLAERVASTTTVTATDVTGSTERPAQTGNKLDGTDGNVDNDWLDSDTDHSESQTVSTVNNRTPTTWIPLITEAQCTPSEQIDSEHKLVSLHTDALIRTTKPAGKPRKRRAKKRSGATAHETGREESDSESPIHPVAAKTSPSVIQNTITAPKQEQPEQLVQATCDTMLSLGARAENRLIGEPDDMFTSGSSSVVVLSHSEDESELPSSDPQKSSPHQMNSVGTVASNLANVNLGKLQLINIRGMVNLDRPSDFVSLLTVSFYASSHF